MKENSINQRYRFLLAKMQLDQKKFADLIKIERQTFNKIVKDLNGPSFDTIYNTIANLPFLNAQWLITGTGAMSNIPEENINLLKEPDIQYKKRCDNCLDLESRLKEARSYNELLNETLKNTREELDDCKSRLEKRKAG
jgi:DNA-binding XRE family transcriptional regulator